MANEEHVKLLKRSIEEWNRWREELREIRPDLSEADLSGANLEFANLRHANMRGVNLRHANLFGADLRHTNLFGVDLCNSNLSEADLSGVYLYKASFSRATLISTNFSRADLRLVSLALADLSEANLSEADLSHAFLSSANLSGTDLSYTILKKSHMSGTILAFTDLSTVRDLDTIIHQGESTLDLNTVILPHGPARTALLRGVGYPEAVIEYYDALFTQPIQFYSCFISYTQADEEVAWKLYTDLQNAGIRCFFAPHDLKPGDYYHKRIDKEIQVHDKLLLLLSEHSVQSAWVEHEVMGALGREKRERREILFPLRLDEAVMETQTDWAQALRDTRHIGDMTCWQQQETYQAAFQEVVRHLKVGLMPPSK